MSIRSLAFALSRALDHDLPDHEHKRRDGSVSKFRPHEDLVEVYHFPQTWSDTSIGFGGVGGQAFTRAYTTVVIDNETRYACVYFAGRLAYKVEHVKQVFGEDLRNHSMAGVEKSGRYR